jgi:hypothetical protein
VVCIPITMMRSCSPQGELLPEWAAEALMQQRPVPDRHGVYELVKPKKVSKR